MTTTKDLAAWRSIALLVCGATVVAGVALGGRSWLESWTRNRLHRQYLAALRDLPEDAAAHWVGRLDEIEPDSIPVLALALADERESVAHAAAETIERLLIRWQGLKPAESSQRARSLARELAEVAPRMPIERRPRLQAIAEQLLLWPLDPQVADAGETIAACESILRLPIPEPGEIQVATLPERPIVEMPGHAELPAAAPLNKVLPAPLPEVEASPPAIPEQPALQDPGEPRLLPGATRELPVEPKQFLPPRAMPLGER